MPRKKLLSKKTIQRAENQGIFPALDSMFQSFLAIGEDPNSFLGQLAAHAKPLFREDLRETLGDTHRKIALEFGEYAVSYITVVQESRRGSQAPAKEALRQILQLAHDCLISDVNSEDAGKFRHAIEQAFTTLELGEITPPPENPQEVLASLETFVREHQEKETSTPHRRR